jgi:hypothetical protein
MGFKEMAPTSCTHGREKYPSGRRNNEPRIGRAEVDADHRAKETCKQKIQHSIILEKINRTALLSFENIQCLEA